MTAPRLNPGTPPAPRPPADHTAAVLALLAAAESLPAGAPAAGAFRAALRRKGEAAVEAGGGTALDAVLARVHAETPDRAPVRTAILAAAWAGLPGAPAATAGG